MTTFDFLPPHIMGKINPEPNSGCWFWSGAQDIGGYGRAHVLGVTMPSHRFLYEEFRGPVPNDLQLDHLCRVRICCNPDHLEPVTCKENLARGVGVSHCLDYYASRTHCKNGHSYAEFGFNLSEKRPGFVTKYCKECRRIFDAKRWADRQAGVNSYRRKG